LQLDNEEISGTEEEFQFGKQIVILVIALKSRPVLKQKEGVCDIEFFHSLLSSACKLTKRTVVLSIADLFSAKSVSSLQITEGAVAE